MEHSNYNPKKSPLNTGQSPENTDNDQFLAENSYLNDIKYIRERYEANYRSTLSKEEATLRGFSQTDQKYNSFDTSDSLHKISKISDVYQESKKTYNMIHEVFGFIKDMSNKIEVRKKNKRERESLTVSTPNLNLPSEIGEESDFMYLEYSDTKTNKLNTQKIQNSQNNNNNTTFYTDSSENNFSDLSNNNVRTGVVVSQINTETLKQYFSALLKYTQTGLFVLKEGAQVIFIALMVVTAIENVVNKVKGRQSNRSKENKENSAYKIVHYQTPLPQLRLTELDQIFSINQNFYVQKASNIQEGYLLPQGLMGIVIKVIDPFTGVLEFELPINDPYYLKEQEISRQKFILNPQLNILELVPWN